MNTTRILIADDHTIVRAGLKLVAKEVCPSAVFDEAHNGDEAISLAKENDYALIILDINMPDTDSISLISNLLAYRQDSKILIFSMNSEELYAKRYFKLGVLGYLNKESGAAEIRRAMLSVLEGKTYTSPGFKELQNNDTTPDKTDNPFEQLSDREMQIAKYFLQGYSYADIQKILNLHTSTIGTHKTRLFGKLKIKSLFDLSELAKLYHLDVSKL
jgi:two-component system invasion response regulator UvrY